MAVNDIVQANIVSTCFNQTMINSMWYYAFSGPGSVVNLLAQLNTAIITPLKNLITSDARIVRLDGAKVYPLPRAFVVSLSINQAGIDVVPTVPINAAITITKQTAFAGRKYRGRWFFSGFSQATLASGQVSVTALSNWQNLALALSHNQTDSDGTVWNPILIHGKIPQAGAVSYTPIIQCRANVTIRNQRRRQIGVGI